MLDPLFFNLLFVVTVLFIIFVSEFLRRQRRIKREREEEKTRRQASAIAEQRERQRRVETLK